MQDGDAAAPDDQGDGDGAEELDDRIVEGVGEDGVGPGQLVFVVDGGEVVEGALLAVEELHDGHAGDVLLGGGVDLCGGRALAAIAVADVVAEELGVVKKRRDDRQRKDRQRPAHPQHDADDPGQRKHILEDGEHAGGEHVVQRVDVGCHARHQPADRVAVEERNVHRLDVAEDLRTEVEHDLLAGPLHDVGLQELEEEGERERAEVQQANFGDARGRVRAEAQAKPGKYTGGREVSVYRDLDEVGAGDSGGGVQQDRGERNADLQLVGTQVFDEPAHEVAVVDLADYVVVLLFGGRGRLGGLFCFVCHL